MEQAARGEAPWGPVQRIRGLDPSLLALAGRADALCGMAKVSDVNDASLGNSLWAEAARCRRLADGVNDAATRRIMIQLAEEKEREASALRFNLTMRH